MLPSSAVQTVFRVHIPHYPMNKERCRRTCVRSQALSRFSVILAAAACLGPATPVSAQTDPPAVPTTFSVASRDKYLAVQVVDVAGADSYAVRWKSGTQTYSRSRQAEVDVSQYDIEGLTNGREYTVQVRATNSAGDSAWSSEKTQTPSVAPDAPVLRLTPGNGSIAVNWDAVPNATRYVLYWFQVENSSNDATISGITTTSHTIDGLEPDRYAVQGWARNTYGNQSVQSTTVIGAPWPTIAVADASAIEGSAVEFAVTLSHAFSENVTVQFSTGDGTATAAGADYTAVTDGTLTFSANDTEETISIGTGDDLVKEVDETFTVTLSNPSSNALLGAMKTATGTIRNDELEPGTLRLCGARVGTPKSRRRDAAVDICWDAGGVIRPDSDVVIEARERYFWYDGEPFGGWREVARGDSFTACGGDDTCLQYTWAETWRGLAFEMELRVRRGGVVLGTSAPLKAHVPNGDANVLRAELSQAIDEDTNGALDAPDGPFVMELQFTDPYLWALLPEIVTGLDPADFEVTNATVTGVEIWDDSGTYKVSVAPTTLGEPVAIGLPATRVKGVGEGISASGGNNYTRDNTMSNTVVQETATPGRQRRSAGSPLTVEFDGVPASHRGRGTFKVRLQFSEPIATGYRTLRDRAVTAVGGRVRGATRVKGRDDRWSITVSPGSSRPVTLRVVSRGACSGSRAVCTKDGRALSNSPTVTIDGPGGGRNFMGPDAGEVAAPVNRPPRAVGTIPPQVLGLEDAELTLDAGPYFTDEDAAGLMFSAESMDPAVAAVTVAGSRLAVSAVGPGTSLVTVTARDAEGLTAEQSFVVRVADRWGRAATGDTLAALGRGYLSSVRSTLGRRADSRSPEAEMTVAGQRIPLDRATAEEVGVSLVTRLFSVAGAQGGAGAFALPSSQPGLPAAGTGQAVPGAQTFGSRGPLASGLPGAGLALASPPGRLPGQRGSPASGHLPLASPSGFAGLGLFGGGASQAWRSTNVVLPLGGRTDTKDTASPGRRWTVWGQGDVQTFRAGATGGAPSASTYDGDLQTAYAGVDSRLSEQWLIGVSLARSFGSGSWSSGRSRGRLSTALTAVHPYVQWSRGGTTLWALGGIGRGTAENVSAVADGGTATPGRLETSGLGLGLGLVEARREVAVVGGGVRLGLRGELSWARLTTDDGGETLHDLQAGVRRTRAGFEASRAWSGKGGASVEPFGRLSVRQDGGAGQTGVGLELESGARVTAGLVRVEAQGRMLALHSTAGYAERGGSVTLSVGDGTQRPGLTLWLAPRWGAAQGADLLWQEQLHRPFGTAAGRGGDRSVDARVGYGWRLPRRLLVSPFGGYGTGWGRRRLQLGATLGALDDGTRKAAPLQVELSGERNLRREGAADHRVSLLGVVTFGGRAAAPPR